MRRENQFRLQRIFMKVFKERVKLPEMARILSRSTKQFRADVKRYAIPHLQLGRDKLFNPEEVEEFLTASQEISVTLKSTELLMGSKSLAASNATNSETLNTKRYKSLLGLT